LAKPSSLMLGRVAHVGSGRSPLGLLGFSRLPIPPSVAVAAHRTLGRDEEVARIAWRAGGVDSGSSGPDQMDECWSGGADRNSTEREQRSGREQHLISLPRQSDSCREPGVVKALIFGQAGLDGSVKYDSE
jgi:hypothetical protein